MNEPATDKPTRGDEALSTAEGKPAPLGVQAKIAVGLIVVIALVALFMPRGESSFEAPGGFVVDERGRPITLASRMAPITLVHFWATWCAPCMQEIPALKRLANDFADEPDFDLLMIAVDDEVGSVEPFLGKLAPMALYDPNWEVAHRYGTKKLPETYLVVGGEVVEGPGQPRGETKWVGATDWDDPEIRAQLREALDKWGGDSPDPVADL